MTVIPEDQAQKQINMLVAYIQHGTVKEPLWGLCQNVLLDDFYKLAFDDWEHFSGYYAYPIQLDTDAYMASYNQDNRHNRRTKYGRLRLDLAEHCLAKILQQVELTR